MLDLLREFNGKERREKTRIETRKEV